MFLDRTVPQISQDWERFGFVRDMKAQLGAGIQRAIDAGLFPAGTQPDAVFRILLDRHPRRGGRAACATRLAPGEDADALARDTLEAALTGLRTGFPTTFVPDALHRVIVRCN